jgi:putative membrane protein
MLAPERDPEIWKGITAGLVGGLVASWTMVQFQKLWNDQVQQSQSKPLDGHDVPEHRAEGENGSDKAEQDDATVRAAQAVMGRPLDEDEKKIAGPAVHYTFGTFMGALYGAATELVPGARAGAGLPFGAAVFLGADEVAVPALGLSDPPADVPLSKHIYGLASHLVYGGTTEAVRRLVRRALAWNTDRNGVDLDLAA